MLAAKTSELTSVKRTGNDEYTGLVRLREKHYQMRIE